jgi:DNA-binding CsgD family transcriptional regulator
MTRRRASADLIGDIYEAAVDDDRWPSIAKVAVEAAGFNSGGVWIIDNGAIADFSMTADGLESASHYIAHYNKLDFWNQGLMRGPWEHARLGYELYPERELPKTEFYNDFLRRYEMYRPMAAVIRLGRNTFATVSTIQLGTRQLLEESDKPALDRVLPHIRRALQLRLTHRHALPNRTYAAMLDDLALGIVVCEPSGRVALANKAAQTMARAGRGIILGGRRNGIKALLPSEAAALAAMIHDAANGGAGGVMRVTGNDGAAALIALVTPLPRRFGFVGNTPAALALVTLRSTRDSPAFAAGTLIALFGLSPAQAEIALAIYNGKSTEQIAVERGVAPTTMRTHLSEIFLRTGAENQRDLVRMLGMLPPVSTQATDA